MSSQHVVLPPNHALQTDLVLAYARNEAAEPEGRWADGRFETMNGSRWLEVMTCTAAFIFFGARCATRGEPIRKSVELAAANSPATSDWERFWAARSVSPAPPPTFLEDGHEPTDVLNLTHGRLSDDVVRRWISADIRRGRADAWAANHLRMDIVNAGVLGPPGLNGTDKSIEYERARGTIELTCAAGGTVAAGVIAVPTETQRRISWADLTDFVVVQVFRRTGEPCVRKLSDGTTERLPTRDGAGELSWQLDTGEFRDDPVVGPLWYQAHGWRCRMDGTGDLDEICGMVHPSSRRTVDAAQQRAAAGGASPRR